MQIIGDQKAFFALTQGQSLPGLRVLARSPTGLRVGLCIAAGGGLAFYPARTIRVPTAQGLADKSFDHKAAFIKNQYRIGGPT